MNSLFRFREGRVNRWATRLTPRKGSLDAELSAVLIPVVSGRVKSIRGGRSSQPDKYYQNLGQSKAHLFSSGRPTRLQPGKRRP